MEDFSDPCELRVFVCVNDRSGNPEGKPSCSPSVSQDDISVVKAWLQGKGLWGKVKLTKVLCFGHCSPEGGNACVLQKQRWVRGLHGAEDLKALLLQELPSAGP